MQAHFSFGKGNVFIDIVRMIHVSSLSSARLNLLDLHQNGVYPDGFLLAADRRKESINLVGIKLLPKICFLQMNLLIRPSAGSSFACFTPELLCPLDGLVGYVDGDIQITTKLFSCLCVVSVPKTQTCIATNSNFLHALMSCRRHCLSGSVNISSTEVRMRTQKPKQLTQELQRPPKGQGQPSPNSQILAILSVFVAHPEFLVLEHVRVLIDC